MNIAVAGRTKEAAPRRERFNWEPLRLPLSVLGIVAIVATFTVTNSHGYDLTAYWTVDPWQPYGEAANLSGQGVFRYAPPIALLFAPLGFLHWDVLVVWWLAAQLAALYSINRRWFLVLVLFPPVWLDIAYGNVNIFLAAIIVAGFRYPGLWAFALLTKVTPGIGVLWFLVRREWRALCWALVVTAGVVLLSLVVQGPAVWAEWIRLLAASNAMAQPSDALAVPLLPRFAAAALLVTWGGLTNRRWVLPAAVTLAMPTLWLIAFTPLVALGSVPLDSRVVRRLVRERPLEPHNL